MSPHWFGDLDWNGDHVLHADSSPRKQMLMLRTKPRRLSPSSMLAAGLHTCGCHENQLQSPGIGAGPALDCDPRLNAGGFVPSFNRKSESTKKSFGPVCGYPTGIRNRILVSALLNLSGGSVSSGIRTQSSCSPY